MEEFCLTPRPSRGLIQRLHGAAASGTLRKRFNITATV